jgi:hypothetical protein
MGEKIRWESEFTTALNRAKAEGKAILLFFHNPGWIGCQQVDAVTYPDSRVIDFIEKNLIPLLVPYNHQPLATDFNVQWTPTLVTLDAEGKEHHRTVGFLSPEELIPSLLLGIAKVHFDLEQFDSALANLDALLAVHPQSDAAPESIFLRGVARYKSTHDPKPLKEAYELLRPNTPAANGRRGPTRIVYCKRQWKLFDFLVPGERP